MDDADRSEERMSAELEHLVAAARGVKPAFAVRCGDCGEALAAHRQGYGRCVPCQSRREAQARRDQVGV